MVTNREGLPEQEADFLSDKKPVQARLPVPIIAVVHPEKVDIIAPDETATILKDAVTEAAGRKPHPEDIVHFNSFNQYYLDTVHGHPILGPEIYEAQTELRMVHDSREFLWLDVVGEGWHTGNKVIFGQHGLDSLQTYYGARVSERRFDKSLRRGIEERLPSGEKVKRVKLLQDSEFPVVIADLKRSPKESVRRVVAYSREALMDQLSRI